MSIFYIKLSFSYLAPGRLSFNYQLMGSETQVAWLLERAWFRTLIHLDLQIVPSS